MEGGVGAFTQELARGLYDVGHEVHIISSRETRPEMADRSFRGRHDPIDLQFAQLHPRIERWRWPSITTIVDIILRTELDIVNIQYQAAAYNMNSAAINLLPWRLNGVVKSVVTFHDLRVPYLFPKAGHLRRAAVNFMARKADGVITTNPEDYETLKSNLSSPITQIPIGSNINLYTPNHIEIAEVRQELGLENGQYLIGFFGFINESKGADILLTALSRLNSRFHLVFIGGQTGASDPTNKAVLQDMKVLIENLDLSERVHWTGFLSETRVSAHLHAADLMVMPYRDGATLRRGTLMAIIAHGRPLLTTEPLKAAPEFVHKKNVWLVPREDTEALGTAIEDLVKNDLLRQTLGENAEKTAQQFTWDKIAEKTTTFFEKL